jgi:uncharacterized protein YndB with AHSA1/START domain
MADRLRPLVPKPLEWIEHAPISFRGSATTTASPDAVFEVLVDYPSWPEWFPSVRSVEHLGDQKEGVGSRRRVRVPGAVFDEEFIAWEPGARWTFTGLAAQPRILAALVEDCRITSAGGRTTLSYTMYVEPVRRLGALTRLSAPMVGRNLTKGMRNLAARAEGRAVR